ncbi:MAG: tetratricopeptide repeat protein, partial [Oceanococcaceae bacterium]
DDLDAWLNTADDLPTAEQQLAGVLGLASPDADAALNVLAELESRRQSAGLAYALAFLALRYERVDRALEALDRAERRGWDPVACDELRLRAQLAREDGEAVSAVAQRLRSAYREDRAAALAVGQLLLDAQAWTLAREQFAFVAQFWPQDPAARMALGLLDAQSGALASAREQFLALWETGARNDEAAWQLGRLAGLEKRWSDSASWFERVEDGGRYLDAQLGLAQVRAEQGDIPAARAQLSMLRDQQPEDAARLWRAEAEILQKAGQVDAAMDLLDAAIADTQAFDLYYQRALLHDTRGDLESARADLQFIIDRDADNAAALNALGYMLADDNRELALARQLVERALALRPDDPAIRDSLGWVLYRQGELAAAEEALQAAYAVYPDPEVAAHLGEVLWHRGRLAEARQVLSEAIRATPSHPKLLRAWMQFGQP